MFNELERYSNRIAVIDEQGDRHTYQQLLDTGDSLAKNIRTGSLVFFIGTNTVESIAGYVALIRRGIVPVFISPSISKVFFEKLVSVYQPEYLFLPKTRVDLTENVSILIQGRKYLTAYRSQGKQPGLYPGLAAVLTTSGSTGSPKFVRLSAHNLQSNARSIIEYLGILPEDRAITTMPMTYSYGLSIINSHLLSGASLIATDATLMERKFWDLMKKEEPTTFGGVPYIYEMLRKLRFAKMKFPSLRYITQAGGRLSPERVTEFRDICIDKGIQFIVMYGQTEATARMSYLPWNACHTRPESIGIPIPGGSFSLEEEDGTAIEGTEKTGELVYRGPNVSLGYAESLQDLSKGDENQGVLRTGDLARRDAEGFYYIVGRKKRFLKIFGNRVNLDEVEQLLSNRGIEAACAGEDDRLIVYLTDARQADPVIKFLVENTGLNHSAFETVTLASFPRNDSGKILYSMLPRMS